VDRALDRRRLAKNRPANAAWRWRSAGNGRWCYLDPKLGAMHAVAEAARKVACTGATPVAATNCLNFGNPEKPEIMAQLSAAIDGIAEACKILGTPITGGNVSLYNETRGEGIYPTPVMGVVGILEDVTKAVPHRFAAHDAGARRS
jgi:phosphoribosylformylglycinamidine (FGAM) synthase-like enzyme